MSDKLHLNNLVEGLPVVLADGHQATVTVNRNKIVFSIGIGFIRPVIGDDGYVTNATRPSQPARANHLGDFLAMAERGAPYVGDVQLATDKPWPVDPAAPLICNGTISTSDIQAGTVPASWVNDFIVPAAPGVPPGWTMDEVIAYQGLQAMQRLAHKTATDAGWYVDPKTGEQVERNFGEVVALMHSELSEALEADRKDLMDDKLPHRPGTEVEFADCLIRIFDTAAARKLDVAGAAIEKNRFNRDRADHKLANRNAEGGKKY